MESTKSGATAKTATAQKNVKSAPKNGAPVQKTGTMINDILNPTATGRIQKMANFQILANKHEFLSKKKNDLEKFIISSDGTKEKVILKNAEGFEFEVSNSQVIEEVLQVIGKKLTTFIEKSEKEVLAYQI